MAVFLDEKRRAFLFAVSWYALFVAVPLGTRKIVWHFIPGFHEYETAFFYFHDLLFLVLIMCVAVCFRGEFWQFFRNFFAEKKTRLLLLLVALSAVSLLSSAYFGLSLYVFFRLAKAIIFCILGALLLRAGFISLRIIMLILVCWGAGEAMLGMAQVAWGHDLGLWFLGESDLSFLAPGVSKIEIIGAKILRAYGTFPHPNIYGAFLILSFGSALGLLFENMKRCLQKERLERIILAVAIFIIGLGIIFSFSRVAWGLAALLFVLMVGHELAQKNKKILIPAVAVSVIFFITLFGLQALVVPRLSLSSREPSVIYRSAYNFSAIKSIVQNPSGVGIGAQVVTAVESGLYKSQGMNELWQWQPIHNLYLLIAVELGLAAAFVFLIFVGMLLAEGYKYIFSENNYGFFTCYLLLIACLLFGLTDHFFWTLEPGRLMFWGVVGIVMGPLFKEKKIS